MNSGPSCARVEITNTTPPTTSLPPPTKPLRDNFYIPPNPHKLRPRISLVGPDVTTSRVLYLEAKLQQDLFSQPRPSRTRREPRRRARSSQCPRCRFGICLRSNPLLISRVTFPHCEGDKWQGGDTPPPETKIVAPE